MSRYAIIGNAGGGKSTLARTIAARRNLPHIELDQLLWREGWRPVSDTEFARRHAEAVATTGWVMDGLGQRASIAARLARATIVILIDMPLWMHFWLAAERQVAWAAGSLDYPPAGMADAPPTRALFQSIAAVDQDWMPQIRTLCDEARSRGTSLTRLTSLDEIDAFAASL